MEYRVYPPIGIARVGNSLTAFYIGPEFQGHPGFDVAANGTETPITNYKTSETEIKRQAARFRVFEVPDGGGTPRPAHLPAGATIEWRVHLVNKKAGVKRNNTPPVRPKRPQLDPNLPNRIIDSGVKRVAGASAGPIRFDQGEFLGRRVPLGEILTDRDQNLLVLGGFGFSSSPTNAPITNFYSNPGWHDDTADGPVTATILAADGSTIGTAAPAWVMVATPDFAPQVQGVVSLYDVIHQVGIDHLGALPPATVSFTDDVFPILLRTSRLQWVNVDPNWSDINEDWAAQGDASAAAKPRRESQAEVVRNITLVLSRYELTTRQQQVLDAWVAGSFTSDWTGFPPPSTSLTADSLTRAALDGGVGQGFFPGIEAGIIIRDSTLYSAPFDFRFDPAQAKPGDLTALMALPWQADFLDCAGNWWPSQRPDDVLPSATATQRLDWARGADTYIRMVSNFGKLAFITPQQDAQGNVVFVETQRAPSSQFS